MRATRRLSVLALMLIGALGVVAASAPPAVGGCPACDEYIWNPPDARGDKPPTNGSSSSASNGSGSSTPTSPYGSDPSGLGGFSGPERQAFAGTSTGSLGSNDGSEDRARLDAGTGTPPTGSTAAGAGVLSAGAGAGGSPIGLIVLAAAALIGLAGLVAVRRKRRRSPAA